VRLKMRNLLTRAVFDKTFKAATSSRNRTLKPSKPHTSTATATAPTSSTRSLFDTLTLREEMIGDALRFLVEGAIIQLNKFNGNPSACKLPDKVELEVTYTEPGARGDTSGNVTKLGRLERASRSGPPLHPGRRKSEVTPRPKSSRPRLSEGIALQYEGYGLQPVHCLGKRDAGLQPRGNGNVRSFNRIYSPAARHLQQPPHPHPAPRHLHPARRARNRSPHCCQAERSLYRSSPPTRLDVVRAGRQARHRRRRQK